MIRSKEDSEAARRRAVLDAARRPSAQPQMWPDPLIAYLRSLEGKYKRTFLPAILCILGGERGPWLYNDVPPVSLVSQISVLELFKHVEDAIRERARDAKILTSIMNLAASANINEESRNRIIATAAAEWAQLPRRLRHEESGLGWSADRPLKHGDMRPRCSPNAALARQPFMTQLIIHLVEYLYAMLYAHDSLHVPLEEVYRKTTRILYLASAGRFRASHQAVKLRYRRSQYRSPSC